MSTITTIQASDLITNSRTDINTNFSNLNTDKIETSVLDTDTTLAANSDSKVATQKAVKAYVDAGGNVNASTTVKGIVEQATDAEVIARTTTGGTGAPLFVNPSSLSSVVKFGGTGADGALNITTGTTTLDCGSAQFLIKNYTSISITGTAKVAFSNPHANGTIVILKSQGAVTITSSSGSVIDLTGMGSTVNNFGTSTLTPPTNGGNGGTGAAGIAGVAPYPNSLPTISILGKIILLCCGSTGGTGGTRSGTTHGGGGGGGASLITNGTAGSYNSSANASGSTAAGTGGRGAGALYLECGGALTFTTGTILATGTAGGNQTTDFNSGAGGGGAGGTVLIVYNTLTSNTGTITVTGGGGGSSGSGDGGGAGATGYSAVIANTEIS